MPLSRFLIRLRRLTMVCTAALALVIPRAGAEPPAPPLAEQLARAQHKHDHGAVVEICRRELENPGADATALLTAIFRAQLALDDLPRAAGTLERLQKTSPLPPPAALAEMRGDLAYARVKPHEEDEDAAGPDAPADKVVTSDQPLDEALTAWREAVTADPADLPGLEGKIADALDKAGRWEEAAGAFRAVLRLVPGHPARQARLAVCLLNSGHSGEADKEMADAVQADAADKTVKRIAPLFDRLRLQLPVLRRLETRIAAGNPPGGPPTADVSTEASTVESASLERALILHVAGANAGALVDATRAARITENRSVAARLLQGQCLWRLGREKEAAALDVAKMPDAKWFEDAARFDRLRAADTGARPEAANAATARAFTARATALLEADQPVLALQQAREAHRRAGEAHLQLDDTEVVLAVAQLRNQHAEEALAAARRATEYAPNNPDGWAILGRVEQEARADFAAAAEHLTRALSLREDVPWLRRRETCLRSLGRTAEADRDAQRLAKLTPAS